MIYSNKINVNLKIRKKKQIMHLKIDTEESFDRRDSPQNPILVKCL